ncbi:leucyl-tRNA synthetase family [Trichomonas vaginalis G3]|nr:leucyl-tRNA synthetase family [Trichomonas vaginalis G3]KAI5485683.1 leucyl-tRNA synthetase family [Trichomonas vaginalis G3]
MSNKRDKSNDENQLWQSRVDELKGYEQEINKTWEDQKIYEVDAPETGRNEDHYMITFPFPYMNGRLHLGHLFTISKAEFAVRYQRMKGKKALFPFAFHCTGMPIKASADKLKRELETGHAIKAADSSKVLKSKMASKTEKNASQVEIMKHIGVPENEIPEFVDPLKWLHYFPPYGVKDMKQFGAAVDWRRSFITTDVNPYFDAFVKWQFRILKEKGYVVKDKRPTICDPSNDQPCMDHDRSSGEGVQPTNYTLIKMQLVDPVKVDERFSQCGDAKVFLLAATLRPETMIGQTNYWVKPGETYDVVKAKNLNEYYVAGTRCVQNLIAQEYVEKADPIFELESNKLLGAECTTPSIKGAIRGFPLEGILMTKGTGIVTCVASDAPADLQGILDLKKNKPMREKYGINLDWFNFEIVKIINSPKYGDFAAEATIKEVDADPAFKKATKAEKLEEAKHRAYMDGFNNGTMIYGPFEGKPVKEAKELAKKQMIAEGSAIDYYEPDTTVIARTGAECVVCLMDQWYLLYGTPEWKQQVVDHFATMECYHPEIREKFKACFDWLSAWACSRQYGLGTRLPFDEQYLIDSLSDSTIYTAFYTISHLLQGDLEGSKPGICGIKPELVNDDFFNYVFRDGPMPTTIPEDLLKKCKREFEFFYPCSCRVSGKDLVTNHLTMWLYNHAAVFDPKYYPLAVRANGFLNLNNKKMSKSEGNFLTVVESIEKYSVSATRIALADAGDGSADANFTDITAKGAMARLFNLINVIKFPPQESRNEIENFFDKLFDAKLAKIITDTDNAYAKMAYKDALKACFFDLQNAWSDYNSSLEGVPISSILREKYINYSLLLLTPIAPQFTDYCWTKLLGHEKSIVLEPFPSSWSYDGRLFFEERFLQKTYKTIGFRIKKGKQLNTAAVFIKNDFTEVQLHVLAILRKHWDQKNNQFDDQTVMKEIQADEVLSKANKKEYMAFLNFYKEAVPEFGPFLLADKPEINQLELCNNNKSWFTKQLSAQGITNIEFYDSVPEGDLWDKTIVEQAQVYIPTANVILVQ